MPGRFALVTRLLPRAYGLLNRTGVLRSRHLQRLYARSYFVYKKYVEDPFDALRGRWPGLLRGGHVLDVGANIGYTAHVFAAALSPGFRVYAFEPEQENFRGLETLVRSRGLAGRIVPVRSAVGNQAGSIALWQNRDQRSDHRIVPLAAIAAQQPSGALQTVPITTLDSFAASRFAGEPVAFVKIDVQGFELSVCKGMTGLIEANPGMSVAVEYAPDAMRALGEDPRELPAFLERRGFALHLLERTLELPRVAASRLDDVLGAKGYADLLCLRGPLASRGTTAP